MRLSNREIAPTSSSNDVVPSKASLSREPPDEIVTNLAAGRDARFVVQTPPASAGSRPETHFCRFAPAPRRQGAVVPSETDACTGGRHWP